MSFCLANMENLRLYVPEHHHRNRRRFWLAVALGGSVVVVIWALQMKSTFDQFAREKTPVDLSATTNAVQTGIRPEAQAARTQVDNLKSALEQVISKNKVKEQVMTQVGDSMKTELEARSGVNPEAGVVAGAETEAQPQPEPVQP